MNGRKWQAARALESARQKWQHAQAEVKRMTARREEIAARSVRDEARKLRFLRRIDRDIAQAREALIVAEADLEMARAEALAYGVASEDGESGEG